jgi:hypothetical protein
VEEVVEEAAAKVVQVVAHHRPPLASQFRYVLHRPCVHLLLNNPADAVMEVVVTLKPQSVVHVTLSLEQSRATVEVVDIQAAATQAVAVADMQLAVEVTAYLNLPLVMPGLATHLGLATLPHLAIQPDQSNKATQPDQSNKAIARQSNKGTVHPFNKGTVHPFNKATARQSNKVTVLHRLLLNLLMQATVVLLINLLLPQLVPQKLSLLTKIATAKNSSSFSKPQSFQEMLTKAREESIQLPVNKSTLLTKKESMFFAHHQRSATELPLICSVNIPKKTLLALSTNKLKLKNGNRTN